MPNRPPAAPDAQLLPEPVGARLLARAGQLDAAGEYGTSVADLRAAAVEAGISVRAFETALGELQAGRQARVPAVRTRPDRGRRLRTVAGVVALLAAGVFVTGRVGVQQGVTEVVVAPLLVETITVSCMSPDAAARIARELGAGTVHVDVAQAPTTLTIHATAVELRGMRSFFEQEARGPACASRAAQGTY